jgi:hypothetical protein
MTLRYSTGLRNHLAAGGSFKRAFQNGRIEIYTGSQPANADAAATGTLLCTITNSSGAHTAEVRATGTITISGSAGSVDTVTIDGDAIIDAAVPWNTSTTQTAADLAQAINDYESHLGVSATSSGAVVTVYAPLGAGAAFNSSDLATTVTTLTATPVDFTGGVTAVNGLKFGSESAGTIAKLASQVWEGTNVAGGTAGWYRMYGSVADAGTLDSLAATIREDGAISTSGQQLNFTGSTTVTAAAKTTINAWSRTVPAA